MDSKDLLEGITPEATLEVASPWELNEGAGQAIEADEAPDIDSSTEDYAMRFSGPVGRYLLKVQNKAVLELVTAAASKNILEAGGGHAQLAPVISEHVSNYTVTGSSPECSKLLKGLIASNKVNFNLGNLLDLPHRDNQFDTVLSIRMLPHLGNWELFIDELCRVSSDTVIVEYPELLSCNIIGRPFFAVKKAVEKNTRPYRLFRLDEIAKEFERNGFELVEVKKQLALPLALHRLAGNLLESATPSRIAEAIAQSLGITKLVGSPVVLRFKKIS